MSVQRIDDDSAPDLAVSRYDLLLFALPIPLLLGVAWGLLASTPLAFAVGLSGLPSVAMLAYGLFVDAPSPTPAARGVSGRAPGPGPSGHDGDDRGEYGPAPCDD